jgi:hypothetical protein
MRAYAVPAIHNEPHGDQPLVQTERGIPEYRSGLHRELPLGVMTAALPPIMFF